MTRTALQENFGEAVTVQVASVYLLRLPYGVQGAARTYMLDVTNSSASLTLPDATMCRSAFGGRAVYTIFSESTSTQTADITLNGGTVIETIDPGEAVQIFLSDATTTDGEWITRKSAIDFAASSGLPNVGQAFPLDLVSSNNVNLRDLCNQQGYDGSVAAYVYARLSIPTGSSLALIGSTSTGTPALVTGDFPSGSTIQITLDPGTYVVGKGGAGGAGGLNVGGSGLQGEDGADGGVAMRIDYSTSLYNYGVISAGGGGGGGDTSTAVTGYVQGGGGGGGEGYTASAGGASTAAPGGSGGFLSAGLGGVIGGSALGYGGDGGSAGNPGGSPESGSGAVGGASGYSIVVDTTAGAALTKLNAGTINGSESTV